MKRCPECRRDYHDDTLSFCLDDGVALLDGPAEPATAILTSESPTKTFGPPCGESGGDETSSKLYNQASNRNSIIAGIAGILIVTALAVGSYLYYGRTGTRQIESIAVMPFVNESGNADIDYLSDGMTETLINSLTQIPNLKVKPRSSTFRYRGRESDAKAAGNELNVAAILNGRLVQRGDEITLFLSLIDTNTEDQLWGKQYTQSLANLLALQTQVAGDVLESLRTKLSGFEAQKIAKTYTTDPEAYRLYLQGRFYWNKRTPKDTGRAIRYFEQAIAIDPNYALAYAGLADSTAQPSDTVPFADREKRAKAAAYKSLQIDDTLAEGHSALGHLSTRFDLDFEKGEQELRRALELNPKWVDTYQRYGELQTFLGRHDKALATYKQGLEIEPYSLPLNATYGAGLTAARRYDEAIMQLKKTLEMDPAFRPAYNILSTAYRMKGMFAESVDARAKFLELTGDGQHAESIRKSFAGGGWDEYLHAELLRYAATSERSFDRTPYYGEATFLAAVGERDRAFAALNKAVVNRENPLLVLLKVDSRLDPLRNDPRFQELLRKLGFPQ